MTSPLALLADPAPDSLPSVARTRHRNNGTLAGAREAINWHATGNATVTAVDDPINEEVDVTITATTNTEEVQDIVGAMVVGGSGLTATYSDAGGTETLDVNVGAGLEISSDAVRIAAAAAGAGLSGGAGSALAVNVDGSTLEINSDTLRAKADGITFNELASTMVPHETTTRVQSGGAGDRTSASYAEIPTVCRVTSFVKRKTATKLKARIEATCYSTNGGPVFLGVNDGTATTDCAFLYFNDLNSHRTLAGTVDLPAANAGTYTFAIYWKTDGTCQEAVDVNDFFMLTIKETY